MKAFGKVSAESILAEIESEKRRISSRRRKTSLMEYYTPPRSMTLEEAAHYAIHKNLNNFYPSKK